MRSYPLMIFLVICTCSAQRKNVLFIVSDDLRPQLNSYLRDGMPGVVHPAMFTPNLDSLAAKSLLLKRSYTQLAVCAPSRTAILTGRRPPTTNIYSRSHYFREVGGDFVTIPQYFKENDYRSIGMGKIFHGGWESSRFDDPISWSEPYWHADNMFWSAFGNNHSWYAVPDKMTEENGPLADTQIADKAIETIQRLTEEGPEPFFLAVGFSKPHLPFIVPEKYFEYYPENDISLPTNPYAPVDMPPIAWCNWMDMEMERYADLRSYDLTGEINSTTPDHLVKELRRAYYAAVSYVDDLVGRVLKQLKDSGFEENTIVSFLGDHGFSLYENNEWNKHTMFERATHSPMMVHIPGRTDLGVETDAFTELVDLYPTLAEAAELPEVPLCPANNSANVRVCSEGVSMVPLIDNPTQAWKTGVFSFSRKDHGKVMGYSVRTERYRYTEWPTFYTYPLFQFDWSEIHGVELYDLKIDPEENVNRVNHTGYEDIAAQLQTKLYAGWRSAMPPSNI